MANLNTFEILTTDLIKPEDRDKIAAAVVNVRSPDSVLDENFSLKFMDHYGRIAIVTFRGIEVLILFKRMTSRLDALELQIGPQAYLKNKNDAWIAFPLIQAYTSGLLADQVKELLIRLEHREQLIEQLTLQSREGERETETLRSEKRKRISKASPKLPPAKPLASADINAALLKIGPLKLQDIVREVYLWAQGFDAQMVYAVGLPYPDVPMKYRKKVARHLRRLDKALKSAKAAPKEVEPYKVRPPKVRKKKIKKVVKKKKTK